jgi:hypothetical protein
MQRFQVFHSRIARVKSPYRSKHKEVPLVSTDEFIQRAPEELKKADTEHQRTLNMLSFELLQRKE